MTRRSLKHCKKTGRKERIKKSLFEKTLALGLAMMLAVSCAGMSLADDPEEAPEQTAEYGDISWLAVTATENGVSYVCDPGQDGVLADGGEIKVQRIQSDHPETLVDINADSGKVSVDTRGVSQGNDPGQELIFIQTQGDAANVDLNAGTLQGGVKALDILNGGGHVKAGTEDITTDGVGVSVAHSDGAGSTEVSTGSITTGGTAVAIHNECGNAKVTTGGIETSGQVGIDVTSDVSDRVNNDVTVNGNLLVHGKDDGEQRTGASFADTVSGTDRLMVNGNIDIDAAQANGNTGLKVEETGEARITVNGEITVKGNDRTTGVLLTIDPNEGTDGKIEAEFNGKITVDGNNATTGMKIEAGADGEVDLKVKGDITVTGTSDAGMDVALEALNDGGAIDTEVMGDVKSTGDGLIVTDRQWIKYDGPITANTDEFYGPINGNSSENWYRHVEGDTVVYYQIGKNGAGETEIQNPIIENPNAPKTETKVKVTGDVTAEQAGAYIALENKKDEMDLIVDGTLSGKDQSVLLSTNTVCDNLTVTVWEIKPNMNGNLVERLERTQEDGAQVATADKDMEKKLQYIIKIQPDQADYIRTEGTQDYDGYQVAYEGDTVTLKLNIPVGYEVVNAFNGTEKKVELYKDADGNYFLVVPRGGGVMLSIELKEAAKEETGENEKPGTSTEIVPVPVPPAAAAADTPAANVPDTPAAAAADTTAADVPDASAANAANARAENVSKAQVAVRLETSLELATDSAETGMLKENIRDAITAGDGLAVLPDEIRAQLPEGAKLAEVLTLTLKDYEDNGKSVTVTLRTGKKYGKVSLVIALPDGKGGYRWFVVAGEGQADESLSVTMPADTAKALNGKTFVTMILE